MDSKNPFSKEFGFICGTGEQHPIVLKIYFPKSSNPRKPLKVVVKREATVAEVIGYCLYCYVEEKCKPDLDGMLMVLFQCEYLFF